MRLGQGNNIDTQKNPSHHRDSGSLVGGFVFFKRRVISDDHFETPKSGLNVTFFTQNMPGIKLQGFFDV